MTAAHTASWGGTARFSILDVGYFPWLSKDMSGCLSLDEERSVLCGL